MKRQIKTSWCVVGFFIEEANPITAKVIYRLGSYITNFSHLYLDMLLLSNLLFLCCCFYCYFFSHWKSAIMRLWKLLPTEVLPNNFKTKCEGKSRAHIHLQTFLQTHLQMIIHQFTTYQKNSLWADPGSPTSHLCSQHTYFHDPFSLCNLNTFGKLISVTKKGILHIFDIQLGNARAVIRMQFRLYAAIAAKICKQHGAISLQDILSWEDNSDGAS